MTIAPIVRTVEVRARPERAFELFTRRFGEWWPKGRTPAASPHVEVVLEPHVEGRWFEIDAAGVETHLGKVLAWDPPARLVLAWQLNAQFKHDPELTTEVEVTFAPEGDGTRVTLEHRKLERFGAEAERIAGQLGGGWPGFLKQFADYVSDQTV